MIPITVVRFGPEEEELVLQVIRSGQLAQGPMVERFEAACREMTGADHAVAVNNGTTALVLAVQALGLGPGDEVITSPFTFVATVNAILESGASVRFADIGDDFNIDPDAIVAAVGPKTRAIMPVHLFGLAADMPAISTIAQRQGLAVIEDAAQAHGATCGGRAVGSWGLGCFSFYATKNLTTGEGGVVTTNDGALADRMRVLRNQGMRQRYQYELAGHNYRMTDLQAAVGVPQFARMDSIVAARRANADHYIAQLKDVAGIAVPVVPSDRGHVWHQFTLRITEVSPLDRDQFVDALLAHGVGCGIYYPKVAFDYECYRSDPRVGVGEMPNAAAAAASVVSIPVHAHLSTTDREKVVAVVREVMGC